MKIVIYKRWTKGSQQGSSPIGTIEMDLPPDAVRDPRSQWRKRVATEVAKMGRIESISTIQSHVEGFHVVVTLASDGKDIRKPGKAVTRGGRPIEPPQARRTLGTLTRGKG
jgi:hypothetical protein